MWIEIFATHNILGGVSVTFREEGVDWNIWNFKTACVNLVTFREEGVDWNVILFFFYLRLLVTFREEGVDWNI